VVPAWQLGLAKPPAKPRQKGQQNSGDKQVPKTQILRLECDSCRSNSMIPVTADPKTVLPIIKKWRAVLPGDASSDRDQLRWYCSLRCLVDSETKLDEALALEARVAEAANA
jgi:hypothetical protein